MRKLLRRLSYIFRSRQLQDDLREELETHRAMMQERLERSGMPADEAAYASRRALGNTTLAREDAREMWIWPSFERLWQDVRYAARGLRKQPTFALTAIVTLAVGIGATTAVFSVVEAELWRPLPFPAPDRLVAGHASAELSRRKDSLSGPEFADWRAQSQAFEELAGFGAMTRRVLQSAVPEFVRTRPVTSNFFAMLQWTTAIGRPFAPSDDAAAQAAIVSDAAWERLFNRDAAIVGRSIVLDDKPYTIVGVLAAGGRLEFIQDPDVYLLVDVTSAAMKDRNGRQLSAIGRLKPGVTPAAANADVKAIAARLATDYPESHKGRTAMVTPLSQAYLGFNWRTLYFFLGAALFVLLLSCANVANLLLARALHRQREFAIRAAIGGGRAALVRQLLVEGFLLALPGTWAGLLIAVWAVGLLGAWVPPDYLSRGVDIHVDARVALFALGICFLITMLFGMAPAFFTRLNLSGLLAQSTRSVAPSKAQRYARHALVVAEVTTAFVLVFGAGLFVSSFHRLTNQPLGFDPKDRLAIGVRLGGARYAEAPAILGFANRAIEQVLTVPGITRAAVTTGLPLEGGTHPIFEIPGVQRNERDREANVLRAIGAGYFTTLGTSLVAGREFIRQDVDGAARVAVIDETFARRYFPNENAIGRELTLLANPYAPWITPGTVEIVGVVSSSKNVDMNEVEFNEVFVPFAQHPAPSMQLLIESAVSPSTVADSVRRAILAVDRDLPVVSMTTMTERVDRALRGYRFHLLLLSAFALTGIILAAVGIYGVMSYATEQRTAEFGLRLALGAQAKEILTLALGQSVRLAIVGIAIGLGVSLALARVLGNALYLVQGEHGGMLFGITTTDPLTLASASVALAIIAVLASFVPARRAMQVDPLVALRAD